MKAYIIQKPDGKFIKKIYTSENYAKKRITNSSRFSNRLNNSKIMILDFEPGKVIAIANVQHARKFRSYDIYITEFLNPNIEKINKEDLSNL